MGINAIELRKVRNFGEVLNATFSFLVENFINILKTSAPVALPIGLTGTLITAFSYSKYYGVSRSGRFSSFDDYDAITLVDENLVNFMYLGNFLLMVGIFFFWVSVFQYVTLYLKHPKEQITFQLLWSHMKKKFVPLIILSIVVSILCGIGYVFFFLPGVYLSVPLSFVFIICMVEQNSLFGNINRSFELIRDEWWSSFALALIMVILLYPMSVVILFPMFFIQQIIEFHDAATSTVREGSTMGTVYAILTPLGYIFLIVSSSIQIVCISIKYFSMVEAKEGVGIMEKVEQMQPEAGVA